MTILQVGNSGVTILQVGNSGVTILQVETRGDDSSGDPLFLNVVTILAYNKHK